MTDVGRPSTASAAVQSGRGRSSLVTRLLVLLLSIVPTITVPVVLDARAAGGDQIADLQAQAAQLSHAVLREQLQIGAFQTKYQADTAQVQADESRISQTQHAIAQDHNRVNRDTELLRRQALIEYTGGSSPATDHLLRLFASDPQAAQIQGEYQQVASGDTASAVARLRTDQAHLHGLESTLESQEQQDAQTQQAAQAALTSSQNTQQTLQAQQATVTGQLAQAVAAQRAAQAAAAAAAIKAAAARANAARQAAAQQAAAQRTVSTTTSATSAAGGSDPAPVASGPNPTLNSFLQCVLQHESGGDYSVTSPNGEYMGGFQFSQSTWNEAAQLAGRPDLVGVPPNQASPADQDELAVALYAADGGQPWVDGC